MRNKSGPHGQTGSTLSKSITTRHILLCIEHCGKWEVTGKRHLQAGVPGRRRACSLRDDSALSNSNANPTDLDLAWSAVYGVGVRAKLAARAVVARHRACTACRAHSVRRFPVVVVAQRRCAQPRTQLVGRVSIEFHVDSSHRASLPAYSTQAKL
jgi:hypothetical protein